MKHEREIKLQERQEIYRQQLMQQQQQRNAQMQRANMQNQQPGMAGAGGQQQRNGTPNGTQGPSPPAQMNNGQPGAPVRHPSQNMMPNGMLNGSMNGMGMNIPQAQMQAAMQGQQRMQAHNSQENLRMAMAQAQQRAAHQQQLQMQQQAQPNNLAAAHFNAPNGAIQTPQMLAALAASRANGSPNGVVGSPGSSTSPRGLHPGQNQLPQQPQQLSSGHTPALFYHQQQVAAQFPHFNAEQIQKLANERLKGQMQRMQANALSAASGSPVPNMGMNPAAPNPYQVNGGMPGGHSPTQYQQQLHRSMQQQQQQVARLSGSPSMSNARPVSRSATPQGAQAMHQRAGSGPGMPDESPRLPQAQMTRP
jgi:chromatin modification-related protein VID21